MKRCNQMCPSCPYIQEGRDVLGPNFKWTINKNVDCNSENVIYMIECTKDNCKARYIGETDRKLKKRLSEHKQYIQNRNYNQATGYHFNLQGHGLKDLKITILEKVRKNYAMFRKEREKYLICKFNTFYGGINRMP